MERRDSLERQALQPLRATEQLVALAMTYKTAGARPGVVLMGKEAFAQLLQEQGFLETVEVKDQVYAKFLGLLIQVWE